MNIREANLDDRAAWDSFVDKEGGSFFHYFDWKYIYEAEGKRFIPLLIEIDQSGLVGIMPVVEEEKPLYSHLWSLPETGWGGFLLRKDLSDRGRQEAISALVRYIDKNYSRKCSIFTLNENCTSACESNEEPTPALIDGGFRFRYDKLTLLPCTHVMELKQPFEEKIWKGLWANHLRQKVNKAERKGVVVIQDQDFKYADDFVEMHAEILKRHRARPWTKNEIVARLNIFRERLKLFVALLDGQPIVTLLCYYTPSTCYLSNVGTLGKDTDDANKLCFKVAIEDACNAGYSFVDLGGSDTSGLAYFKEQFKGTRYPLRAYEKSYSFVRSFIEATPILIKKTWHDKYYIWKIRRTLWERCLGR